jgi:hypothetical protein
MSFVLSLNSNQSFPFLADNEITDVSDVLLSLELQAIILITSKNLNVPTIL